MPENCELSEDLLTLEDVAMLLSHTDHLPARVALKLPRVIGTDPRLAAHVGQLQDMAREAGLEAECRDWPEIAFLCHRDLDRLLAAEDWQHPAEVLDPDGEVGVSYRELIRAAETRARRSDDPKLPEVRRRLKRAWAAERMRTGSQG